MHSYLPLLSLVVTAVALPASGPRIKRSSAPSGCLSVGRSAQYKTVQSAVDALSTTSKAPQCIFIAAGTYHEQVSILKLKSPLTIYGETTDTSSYTANTVTITQSRSLDNSASDDLTATLRAWVSHLKVYNVNLVNTRGSGSRALALSAWNSKQGYYGCQFKGFQDTLLADTGTQIYAKSLIQGATDFIFGQDPQAWFDGVDIRVVETSVGYITASGRSSSSSPSWFVINRSTIAAASGSHVPAGTFYLGRPWLSHARVMVQDTSMSNVINGAGWAIWANSQPNIDNVAFTEFGNHGDGSNGKRAKFSSKLSAPVRIDQVLGSDYKSWVDTRYLS
ncbi:hypothetical protein ACEQ8H_002622 [Pleosporales sp. CAS-2024a]